MSTLKDDLDAWVDTTLSTAFVRRDGRKVPSAEDVKLGNDAVDIDGTVLYADLAESTSLVTGYHDWFAAKIYKTYLYCAAKIIRFHGGVITAYDGDRIMAVFIGDGKNSAACKAAMKINYARSQIIQPRINAKYTDPYVISHRIGIDSSKLMVARTGIRGSNDLVWVGNAANYAAKLSDMKLGRSILISGRVYEYLNEESKYGGTPKTNMWTDKGIQPPVGRVYGSDYWWTI